MADSRKRRWQSAELQALKKPLDGLCSTVESIAAKPSDTLYDQGVLQFLELKGANRELQLATEQRKAETLAKKQEIDATNLLLYNLKYEKNHFSKLIRTCRDFRGSYSDIDLVSVEEFKANAPPELSNVDSDDEHKLMLNRLAYELQERKRLCAEREAVLKKKKALIASNEKKTHFLSSLHQNLKALEEATQPIQENLGIRHSFTTEFHNAHHLPRPLYVLYLQAVSYRDTFEASLEVQMEGDVEAAIKLASQPEEEDVDDPEEEGRDAKRRKKDKDADEASEEDKTDVTQTVHPLSVVVKISGATKQEQCTLTFRYLTELMVVSVLSKWSPQKNSQHSLLMNLFPDDTGANSPNPANSSLLDGSLEFDSSLPARPYKWVQWLAGLTFLETSPQNSSSVIPQESFRAVMARIHARIKHRVTLAAELSQLGSTKRPQIAESQAEIFQLPATATIDKWSPNDSGFTLVMSRGEYTLQANIQVSSEYPVQAPLFKLEFAKHPDPVGRPSIPGVVVDPAAAELLDKSKPINTDLEAMEQEVNAFYDELLQTCDSTTGYNLLSLQVRKLQMCFDIYVSTEVTTSTKGGKICFRAQRGRTRKRPFQFNPQTGLFDQRR